MAAIRIPLSGPDITDVEIQAVTDVLKSRWLSLGPKVPEFEKAFASYLGCKHAVACNSGTSGLHMMMLAAGVGPGDEVITSTFSFIASANCIEMVGAKPVFVDIDPISLNMDPRKVQKAVTEKTKAILSVHIFGLSCEAAEICDFASSVDLPVLEDACESLGATAYGRKVGDGTYGIGAAWGFYPNKQITTGEGGMVTTNDDAFADKIRTYRNQGRRPNSKAGWLIHEDMGFNFRLDEMSAALGVAQMSRIDEILARREDVANRYSALLRPMKDKIILPMELAGFRRSWFVYPFILRQGWSRDRMVEELGKLGIQCGKYFAPPIHLQAFYSEKYGYRHGDFPISEGISNQILALPFHTNLSSSQVDEVCGAIERLMLKTPDLVRMAE